MSESEPSHSEAYTEHELDLPTGTIKYLTGGSGSPIVVFHHSWGSPGWLDFHAALAETHHVIVPDMPGWGGSARPVWARDPRDIAILMGHFIDRVTPDGATVVGLGFGGFVAAELATISSDRLHNLVLVGAAGLKPDEGEIADQMMVSHRQYIEDSFRDKEAYEAYLGAEEPPPEVSQLWDFSREMTARVTWKPYMFNRRLAPLLGNVETPTLIVWGDADHIVPRICADQYAEALPNARIETVADAGHVVELEQPAAFASLIQKFVSQ